MTSQTEIRICGEKMEKVRVSDLTKIRTGKLDANASSEDGKYPFFTCSKEPLRISTYTYDCECVLVAGNGDLNVKYYNGKFDAYQRTYIIEDNSNGKLYIPYLYYFMEDYVKELRKQAIGGVIKYIKLGNLTEAVITVPSIDRQKEIVEVLKKVGNILENYSKKLCQLDVLIKARFVEMFGDVKDNPHNYEIFLIKTLLKSCEAGWSANGTQREKKDNEIAVLKVSSVTKGYFIPEECKVLDDQANIKKYVTPEKGDLIFSRANTREMVGATAVIMEDYPLLILPDKLWKIKFKSSVNVFYMKYVLSSKSIRNEFSAASTGTSGSMYNVSMDKFKSIKIPVAPIELQNQFADFVRAVDKSKVAVQKALDEAQLLFDSLMQEYFG